MSPFFQPMKAVKATKPSAIRSTLVIRSGGYSCPRIPGMRGRLAAPGGVVQLVRTPACHAGGRGFESRRSRSPRKSGRSARDHDDLRGFVLRSVADPAAAAPQREEKERRKRFLKLPQTDGLLC